MEDHYYVLSDKYIENTSGNMELSPENVTVEEKEGDDFLIDLYRERKYLYDKNHRDFKNKQIKENAWVEISTIMQQKNIGQHYTPQYCQTRCSSLRDQYSREKRNMNADYKSGSSCSKRRTFPFFTQLSFLDNFIKRRRTFSNIARKNNTSIHESCEKNSNNSTDESEKDESEKEQQDAIKIPHKKNISACKNASDDSQDTENSKKEINSSKYKRRKINESINIDDTFANVSNAIMSFLESTKENTTENTINSTNTVDESFIDYIRVHLGNIPEPEKSVRKKMLFEALTSSLSKM